MVKSFYTDKDLLANLDKTKLMVFNTTKALVTRPEAEFLLEEEKVAHTILHIPRRLLVLNTTESFKKMTPNGGRRENEDYKLAPRSLHQWPFYNDSSCTFIQF